MDKWEETFNSDNYLNYSPYGHSLTVLLSGAIGAPHTHFLSSIFKLFLLDHSDLASQLGDAISAACHGSTLWYPPSWLSVKCAEREATRDNHVHSSVDFWMITYITTSIEAENHIRNVKGLRKLSNSGRYFQYLLWDLKMQLYFDGSSKHSRKDFMLNVATVIYNLVQMFIVLDTFPNIFFNIS